MATHQNRSRRRQGTFRTWTLRALAYALLLGFGFIIIFPFLYMLSTSLKTSTDVFRYPPELLPLSQATTEYNGEQVPVYRLEADGEVRSMVATGDDERFGFFTTQDLLNVDDPRSSELVAQLPLDEATDLDEEITLTETGGDEEAFDVYEVPVDGSTERLLLAYRSTLDRFVAPDEPSAQTYATERTAPRQESVNFQWANYRTFFSLDLDRALVNTALVTLFVVVGQLVTSIFGGYAFSRIQFRGRDTLFLAYLGSIMIPFVVLIIPMYRLMVILDWQTNSFPLSCPGFSRLTVPS